MARLVIVSNRVAVPEEGGKAVAAGGLAVAVKEAFTAYEGLWFGWSGNISDEPSEEPTLIDRDRVQYAVVDLSPQDHKEYYAGFANRALWPIMHYRLGLGAFSRSDYAGYSRVNRIFARALAKLVEPDDIIWVHDYHLLPMAAELARPRARESDRLLPSHPVAGAPTCSTRCRRATICCAPSPTTT